MVIAHIGAEIAFQRPERDDDRCRHAKIVIDARKHRRVGFYQRLPALDAVGGRHAVGKLQERLAEDALAAVDIHDTLIVGQVRRGGGNRALRDAGRHRLALEVR